MQQCKKKHESTAHILIYCPSEPSQTLKAKEKFTQSTLTILYSQQEGKKVYIKNTVQTVRNVS